MALKPKVLTARELEEQQKEAAKSEEIVKAKASHHSAFLARAHRTRCQIDSNSNTSTLAGQGSV